MKIVLLYGNTIDEIWNGNNCNLIGDEIYENDFWEKLFASKFVGAILVVVSINLLAI